MAKVTTSAVETVLSRVDKVHLLDTMMNGTMPFNKRLEAVVTEVLDAAVRCYGDLHFHNIGTEDEGVY